jgi:sec-independent protein translocase protein TatA
MPFPNIGPGELILILIIALLVLGPGKLPDVAASLGKSLREFRRAATDVSDAAKLDAPAPAPAIQAPTTSPAANPASATAPDAVAEAGSTRPTERGSTAEPVAAAKPGAPAEPVASVGESNKS